MNEIYRNFNISKVENPTPTYTMIYHDKVFTAKKLDFSAPMNYREFYARTVDGLITQIDFYLKKGYEMPCREHAIL